MSINYEYREKYNILDLIKIVEILRSPKGCPWDREQTHKSIRHNFIEETYEVLEAIDKDDSSLLAEELGDVLLQIVLHAQIEAEKQIFNFGDIADGICKKLILRHPHVFGKTSADTASEALKSWDDIKRQEKSHSSQTEAMKSIPVILPALMRAYKLQQKASNAGFDWSKLSGPLDKLKEEIEELSEAIKDNNPDRIEEELGDLLFSVVNISRFAGVEPETALHKANNKFLDRFEKLEALAADRGIDMYNADIALLDQLWDTVKQEED